MNAINDEISKTKLELHDPLIIIGGDFNKKPYHDAINDFPDIELLLTGPTRQDEVLDLVFTNIPESTAHTRPPLESDCGVHRRAHLTVYVEAEAGNDH